MQVLLADIPNDLHILRQDFIERGFDLRLVGGCVRDLLRGEQPKDIDLCTDADPDEQMAIYRALGTPFYETGLQHGTLTVNTGAGIYEITSLRTETDHDGRHAQVSYTRDWHADLGRRDLTINAMALTFDGELVDPFGGAADLKAGRVVFVGSPDDRIREDYLRILRWLRFHARIANQPELDQPTMEAVRRHAGGLRTISKERVWMEVPKIISGNIGPAMIAAMHFLGIDAAIGLPLGDAIGLARAWAQTRNPVTLLTAYLGDRADHTLATWRASTAERQLARFLASEMDTRLTIQRATFLLAVDRVSKEHVQELALMQCDPVLAVFVKRWEVPAFPVTGDDLMAAGVPKGPNLGQLIARLKLRWADSNYTYSKGALMTFVQA